MSSNIGSNYIWTSEKIKLYNEIFSQGLNHNEFKNSPYYKNIFGWRDGNLLYKYTDYEKEEIIKCKNDVLYFANNYAYAMTDFGVEKIKIRDYQKDILKSFQNNRFNILVSSRQTGKTVMAAIFIAWYICFHYDRYVLVVANKLQTTTEIVTKIKYVLLNLPFFLKPGILSLGETGITFDNGCKLNASATTPTAGIGFTNHLVYADEFAYVHPNIADKFFKSIFPTLVSSKISRMIISSTPNGKNLFYKIYKAALNGENEFKALRTDWWQVPGRDEKWKQKEIKNLGSEELFNQEYGNSFDVSSKMLATSNVLKLFERIKVKYEWEDIDYIQSDYYNSIFLKWHSKIFENLTDDDKFVVSVDLGSGIGGDYTVVNIFKVEPMSINAIKNAKFLAKDESDFFKLIQVGMFRDNKTSIAEVAYLVADLVMDFLLPENTLVVVELNHRGEEFMREMEFYRQDLEEVDNDIFFKGIEKTVRGRKVKKRGILTTKDKFNECKQLLKEWQNKRIIATEEHTYIEISSFGLNEKGTSFEGLGTNDDTVMSMVNLVKIFGSSQYFELVEDLFLSLPDNVKEVIYDKLDGTI